MEHRSRKSWKRFIGPVIAIAVGVGVFGWMFRFQFFGDYIHGVLAHWLILMTGLASVLTELYKGLRKSHGKYIPYVVAAMCVFFACFQAWQDQHSRASSLEGKLTALTVPKLSARIDGVFIGQVGEADFPTFATVFASINNTGAPTILDSWGAVIKLENGRIIEGQPVPYPIRGAQTILQYESTRSTKTELTESNHLIVQSKPNPIVTGGGISGWIAFVFQIKRKEASRGTLTLSFDDVYQRHYSVESELTNILPPPINLEELARKGKAQKAKSN